MRIFMNVSLIGYPNSRRWPARRIEDVVFGTKAINYHTVEADICINFESELSETLKSNFVLSHSQFDKVYQMHATAIQN